MHQLFLHRNSWLRVISGLFINFSAAWFGVVFIVPLVMTVKLDEQIK